MLILQISHYVDFKRKYWQYHTNIFIKLRRSFAWNMNRKELRRNSTKFPGRNKLRFPHSSYVVRYSQTLVDSHGVSRIWQGLRRCTGERNLRMSREPSNCPFTIFGTCLLLKKTWKVTSCETSGLPQFLEYLIALRVAGKSVPGACMAIDIGARQRSSSGSRLSRNV